jgi:hypothetical protein
VSTGDPIKDRIARAREILRAGGFLDADVSAEGPEREIAAVRVPPDAWERLAGPDGAHVAEEVKSAGFRYVALDLLPSGEASGAADVPAETADSGDSSPVSASGSMGGFANAGSADRSASGDRADAADGSLGADSADWAADAVDQADVDRSAGADSDSGARPEA